MHYLLVGYLSYLICLGLSSSSLAGVWLKQGNTWYKSSVLLSQILWFLFLVQATYVDSLVTIEQARDYGHIHMSEVDFCHYLFIWISYCNFILPIFFLITFYQIINYASKFENKAILLIHFSARYQLDVSAISVGLFSYCNFFLHNVV